MDKETEIELCSSNFIHESVVKKVKENMIEDSVIEKLANFFKVLGDPTRVKILHALSIDELCVCDISNLLDMTQSAISHQLRILRAANLVKCRRDGKVVYYSLNDEHVENVFGQGLEHIME